jgi:ATP-dependent DNA helicase RecG
MPKKKISSRLDFLSPLSRVHGLGSKRVAALKESGIETLGNLLYHFPRKYIDRSIITPIAQLPDYIEKSCAVIGTITRTQVERGKRSRFRIQVSDDSGSFEVIWFHGIPFFRKSLYKGKRILLYGKVGKYITCQMYHPLVETISANKSSADIPFLPQYPLTMPMKDAHIQQRTLFNAIHWILKNLKHYPQILPERIEKKKNFPSLETCLHEIHIPKDPTKLNAYFDRLRYEELYQLAITLRWSKRKFALPGRELKPGILPDTFKKNLPFTLTDEQEKAITILYADAASPHRMHRLLQGDVGSGKTVVAFFACLPALNQGLQVAWLAPTEVLARQTYAVISSWLKVFNIKAGLLKGGISSKQKRELLSDLSSGKLSFIVGTHALLQPSVTFLKLGMIIIDEQHKFGVEQRLTIQQKDPASDFLLMSATPIPQSLAKTLYGDLDIVTIRSIPRGRMPVNTHIVTEAKRLDMEKFIAQELQKNNSQAFYVVPRIDCDGSDENEIKDITTVFDSLKKGTFKHIPIAAIHGRIDITEKEHVMNQFAQGDIKMIVATTVIEVGIDVSSATIMVVENAERFGLSQLHQLRGRVGRGNKKSFIFLLTNPNPGEIAKKRLQQLCKMHDGFDIADLDLKLRGPGEVAGFRQSGWDELHIADILEDADTFREIQEELDELLVK